MPLRWLAAGLAAGLFATVLVVTAAARLGLLAAGYERPDTHWFWYLGRATGISAYLALALSVLWGLLLSTGVADAWIARARSVDVHRWISAVGLGLVAGHALVLLGDPYVRFDVLDLLVPFASAYRPVAVGLGVLAAYAVAVVFGSFWLRRRLGQRAWRMVHYLAFPALGLVTAHGLLAGADTATPWMRVVYLAVSTGVVWLTVYRLVASFGSRAARGCSATAESGTAVRPGQPIDVVVSGHRSPASRCDHQFLPDTERSVAIAERLPESRVGPGGAVVAG
jgi:predicted ferric reductase